LESVDTENLSGRQELLELFETYINADLLTWLLDLPFNLAKRRMVREAADLGLAWSEITKAENFLGDRTVILAEAGLEKEARRQIRQNLKKFPDDVWIKIKAGEAYEELGDTRAAELQYRRSLDITESGYDRAGVLERLIPLLSETGKEAEARALEVEERRYEFEEQEEEEEETSTWMTDMSREPKVGRNEPCPCGSGKKYKKCCLNKAGKEEISSSV
jgi:tetratricopeptide (TPR) repeat protein